MRKEAEERAAEEREQAAKEAKEAAANVPQYRVKPAIEHVPGTKSQRNYKFKIVRPSIIPRAYLMPDEVAIGRMVRDKKDKILAETECPGIEVWSE